MEKREKWPLYVGIAIPVVMILVIALVIYVPRLFADSPLHNFVYVVHNNGAGNYYAAYNFHDYFEVKEGKLMKKQITPYDPTINYKSNSLQVLMQPNTGLSLFLPIVSGEENKESYDAQAKTLLFQQQEIEKKMTWYVHDVTKNESMQSAFEAITALTLDPNALSADGFQVVQGGYRGGDFFPFGGGYDNSSIISGANGYRERLNLPAGFVGITFVGWITSGR